MLAMWKLNNYRKIVGQVCRCFEVSGIYTRAHAHLDWIENIVGPNQ